MPSRLRTLFAVALCLASAAAGSARANDVSTEDVRRFLDPTVMISKLEYRYQANHLPDDFDVYTHKLRPWIALNNGNAVWARVPFARLSRADGETSGGLGDVSLGWGRLFHENLERRLTAFAATAELKMPTGDPAEGTSLDAYVGNVVAAIVTNPTDMFPVFVIARYLHSFDKAVDGLDIRSAELTVQSFHILPRGFYLLLIPSFLYDFERDFDVFSFGAGGGKALTRRFAMQAAYVQYISGQKTFNRGFTIGLNYMWGTDKGSRSR
ncbi:hypothetical protein DRQ53_12690 [bacterium]|nr:MAG: hypothetical protein DRQ53_12690 [bacterium]